MQEWGGQEETATGGGGAELAFKVYGQQIQSIPRFKDLGRVLTEGDDDWPGVAGNLE